MRLALDLDGCEIEFVDGENLYAQEVHGLPWREAYRWMWFEDHGPAGTHAYKRFMESNEPEVLQRWLDMTPTPGSLSAIAILEGHDHEITFVTHRPEHRREVTELWLERHGLDRFPVIHVDPTAKDDHEDGSPWSSAKSDWHEADFWLDDNTGIVNDLLAAGYNAYLFSRTWNEADRMPAQRRLKGWGDVLVQVGLDQMRLDAGADPVELAS